MKWVVGFCNFELSARRLQLLDEPDWDIYYWSTGKREVPAKWKDTEILAR